MTAITPRFDSKRNPVSGNALHVYQDGDGFLHVGITYPVAYAGKTTDREVFVRLTPADRAKLTGFMADSDYLPLNSAEEVEADQRAADADFEYAD